MHLVGIFAAVFFALIAWSRLEALLQRRAHARTLRRARQMLYLDAPSREWNTDKFFAWLPIVVVACVVLIFAAYHG